MKYNGLPCPKCGRIMNDDDDIVVCPECATPQHRSCWLEDGHCVNAEKHSSGYVWTPNGTTASSSAQADGEDTAQSKTCVICGSENPADALHCGNCGALFQADEGPKACRACGQINDSDALHCKYCGMPLGQVPLNPYLVGTGIDENEKIGDIEAGEAAYYVRAAAPRYIPKFRKIASGKKISFNWAAFFFSPYWFFYRKIYKAGIIFMLLFAAVSLALTGPVNEYMDAVDSFYSAAESSETTDEQFEALYQDLAEATGKTVPIIAGVSLLLRLACGFGANHIYYRKMKKDHAFAYERLPAEANRKMQFARLGGTSAMLFAAGFFGYNCIITLLTSFADLIIEKL